MYIYLHMYVCIYIFLFASPPFRTLYLHYFSVLFFLIVILVFVKVRISESGSRTAIITRLIGPVESLFLHNVAGR